MAFASQRAIGREAWLHRVGLLCVVVIGLLGVSTYLRDRAPGEP